MPAYKHWRLFLLACGSAIMSRCATVCDSLLCLKWLGWVFPNQETKKETKKPIYMCDMTHSYAWHASFIRCDMPHSYVWYDSVIFEKCLIHIFDMPLSWRIHIYDMTNSYLYHDSFICVPWCIHTCATVLMCNKNLCQFKGLGRKMRGFRENRQNRPPQAQNMSDSQFFADYKSPGVGLNMHTRFYVWNINWENVAAFRTSRMETKNWRITILMFLPTFRLNR